MAHGSRLVTAGRFRRLDRKLAGWQNRPASVWTTHIAMQLEPGQEQLSGFRCLAPAETPANSRVLSVVAGARLAGFHAFSGQFRRAGARLNGSPPAGAQKKAAKRAALS
jgi:hypothetical protein